MELKKKFEKKLNKSFENFWEKKSKDFSPFGVAVWPAIANIYINRRRALLYRLLIFATKTKYYNDTVKVLNDILYWSIAGPIKP